MYLRTDILVVSIGDLVVLEMRFMKPLPTVVSISQPMKDVTAQNFVKMP